MDIQVMLLVVVGLSVFWYLALTVLYVKQQQVFKLLTTGVSKKDLKTILELIDSKLNKQQEEIKTLRLNLEKHQDLSKKNIQKYAMVRFNPFDDTGGNQSFSMSLLNADNDGYVLTSLHSRDLTRVYAKEIRQKNGKKQDFSKEEQEAITQAMKGHS
ncbi:MAG: DUF4446 family protein [Candidatus Pacebacteria bacterium]|nr:DUF4446 family protein [Candidatus Paceibacterota bacterium]